MADRTLAVTLVLLVAVPALLAAAHRPADDRLLRDWAQAHGLALTDANRAMVAWYLRTSRALRAWGAVAGIVVPTLVELAWTGRVRVLGFGTDGSMAPGAVMAVFVGYLVGALYAELSLARPAGGARRSASLVPRRLEDYLPRHLVSAQRALCAAAVAGAAALAVVPYDAGTRPGRAGIATLAVVVVALTAGIEALERWLVRRPQPFTSPSLVAADDAIRAQSVHSVAGAGVALLLCTCAGIAAILAASDVPVLRSTMWLPALVCFVLALAACRDIGGAAWHVRRRLPGSTGAASA